MSETGETIEISDFAMEFVPVPVSRRRLSPSGELFRLYCLTASTDETQDDALLVGPSYATAEHVCEVVRRSRTARSVPELVSTGDWRVGSLEERDAFEDAWHGDPSNSVDDALVGECYLCGSTDPTRPRVTGCFVCEEIAAETPA